ncbi:MAG: GNAT family N-acetyltransferase [Rhodospirillales bacterium]|nr:GNAT family N-acetyltransferase [Rhodospirillales bacterium]
MKQNLNQLGQPIGESLPNWIPARTPDKSPMEGKFCRLEALDCARHATDLFEAYSNDKEGKMWTYLSYGPFQTQDDLNDWLQVQSQSKDPVFFAIIEKTSNKAVGLASYLRIQPKDGVIEVGHLSYSPLLQKTPTATNAMFLMMKRAFNELGYRRYEWKCDSLNAESNRAAQRLGFSYDGRFRQAMIYKGRNRDTAWYSILDRQWPGIEKAYEQWLSADNFDGDGRQLGKLADMIAAQRISPEE